jgi:hypothetical protein
MTPTNKLRFVEREAPTEAPTFSQVFGCVTTRTVRILQQWWEDRNIMLTVHITDQDGNPVPSPTRGEWRDVPVEKEHG